MRSRKSVPVLVLFVAACCPIAATAQDILIRPYIQPGASRTDKTDGRVIHWFTNQKPGEFVVEYRLPVSDWKPISVSRQTLDFAEPELEKEKEKKKDKDKKKADPDPDEPKSEAKKEPKVMQPAEIDQHFFKYTARIEDLPLDTEVRYRVKLKETTIREASFRTNASADKVVRCVLVGDMAQGRPYQHGIAYQIGKQNPDFLIALGDIVYPTGRINQYMAFYWNTYNNLEDADPEVGAPLMASVPFYPVLGNHDIGAKLSRFHDALAAYYFFSPPKNGPGEGPWATPLDGDDETIAKFRATNKDSYPYIDAYSFDNGPAHFVVLNVNPKMKLDDAKLRKWLIDDLRSAKDRWKIVCFHMPGFQSSVQHYAEQQVRPLQPLFEEEGVALTFAGHVHNYQRTVPLKFVPDADQDTKKNKGRVDGKFTLDKVFDGAKNTLPQGVIHVVSGGGGASLYGPGVDKTKDYLMKKYGPNYADFTAKTVVDKNSFTVLECASDRLHLRAIASDGTELDRIVVTKK
jgi:hypothetical protein